MSHLQTWPKSEQSRVARSCSQLPRSCLSQLDNCWIQALPPASHSPALFLVERLTEIQQRYIKTVGYNPNLTKHSTTYSSCPPEEAWKGLLVHLSKASGCSHLLMTCYLPPPLQCNLYILAQWYLTSLILGHNYKKPKLSRYTIIFFLPLTTHTHWQLELTFPSGPSYNDPPQIPIAHLQTICSTSLSHGRAGENGCTSPINHQIRSQAWNLLSDINVLRLLPNLFGLIVLPQFYFVELALDHHPR